MGGEVGGVGAVEMGMEAEIGGVEAGRVNWYAGGHGGDVWSWRAGGMESLT